MGRKIPAKKHRGVKDPLEQHAKRVESLKGKINAPPRDPDEQPVPKSLLRLFGAPAVERRAPPAARAHRAPRAPPAPHAVARLQRLPGESAHAFSRRITGATRALHTAEDPHHYPEDEEEEERPSRRRRAGAAAPRPSKAQRRKQKLQQKKQEAAKTREADAASELVYERVAFGELACAPPALRAGAAARPGRRELLLSPMLAGAAGAAGEQRRLAVVAAYRALRSRQRLAAAS